MERLAFFPTPYPDEVLYSILCRYHVRSGNPGMNTTIRELWKYKGVAKSLYLPNGLNTIVDRLPEDSGITLDNLIWEHTMYPYVRLALPRQRDETVYDMLCGREKECKSTYQKAGLIGRKLSLPQYLRFCPMCIQSDIEQYGEAYWHRLHQLPGVYICLKHREYIRDSSYFVHMIFRYFFPATSDLCSNLSPIMRFSKEVEDKLIIYAEDSAWILKHGGQLGTLENMYEKYFRLLELKGYRWYTSTSLCNYQELNQAIHTFYGKELLKILCAYDEDDYFSWPASFTRNGKSCPPTSQHQLMIRFLADSPQKFLETDEYFKPFGKGPWPCHNKVCDFYLKDCIEHIDVEIVKGQHKTNFTCPHCGFSYHRGKATPKELQYEGQVQIVDFGWLWRDTLKKYLSEQKLCVHKTAKHMQTSDDTVLIYGIQMNLLPESRMPNIGRNQNKKGRIYKKREPEPVESHRIRWLRLIDENPDMNRSALGRKDLNNYKWILSNDLEWFEVNTPAPVNRSINWDQRDKDYLKKVTQAVADITNYSGRPQWLCYSAIANRVGIGNRIYQSISKLPKTKEYLDSVIESKDEWRKRRILWAIEMFKIEGKSLSMYSIREKSGVSTTVFHRFKSYIMEQIVLEKENE